MRRRTRCAVVAAVLGASVVTGVQASVAAEAPAISSSDAELAGDRLPYPGDPESEAGHVAAEDDRLVEVRTVDSLAAWSESPLKTPFRLATGSAYTLVLTARREPYTIRDLLALAPQTFVQRPDGAFLLSEHLVIQQGATLNIAASGGLRLLMASDGDAFVSIVNMGGRLNISGAEGAPIEIASFDRETEQADALTDDGRAYIRSIGGQIYVEHAEISDLGFWSGRTGGLSLTGTDRPNGGSLDELGETLEVGKRAQREREAAGAGTVEPAGRPDINGRASLSEILPAGDLPVPLVDVANPQYSFVSASITDSTVRRNAFGLFVSGANGLDVRRSSFSDSLVDGIVMHRYVVNAVVEESEANRNGGDGIVLARATTGIVVSEVQTGDNARNGITISGLPLAEGPSATGISVGSYGNNSVANSQLSGNGRYGVEVVGGINIKVLANDVRENDMGIVVREGAEEISVVGNSVVDSARQGIAVRDGVGETTVSGNQVIGGETSVYVRDSAVRVKGNTLDAASSHAASFVGAVDGTSLEQNTLSGRGPSAVDFKRAVDLDRSSWDNDDSGWEDTTPFLVTLKRFLQPLTLMWVILGAMLVFTALRGARSRRVKTHPYADKGRVTDGALHSIEELREPAESRQ